MTLRLSGCQPWREGSGRGQCTHPMRAGRRFQSVESHFYDVQNKRGGMMAETLSSTAPLRAGDKDTGEDEGAADDLRQRHGLAEKQPAGKTRRDRFQEDHQR
jgi:hypothetical protein